MSPCPPAAVAACWVVERGLCKRLCRVTLPIGAYIRVVERKGFRAAGYTEPTVDTGLSCEPVGVVKAEGAVGGLEQSYQSGREGARWNRRRR